MAHTEQPETTARRLTPAEVEANADADFPAVIYCATCGNPADNPDYAKPCCTADNMLED